MAVQTITPNAASYADRVQFYLNDMYARNPSLKRPPTNPDGSPKIQTPSEPSPVGIVGAIAAPIAIREAIKYALKDSAATSSPSLTSALTSASNDAWNAGANAATNNLASNTLSTPEVLSVSRVPGAATAQLTPLNYAAGGLGVGLGGYNAYKGLKSGNPIQAGLGGVGLGLGLNSLGLALGPAGWAAMAALPVAAKLGLLSHESTRDRTAKNTASLAKLAPSDSVYQNYLSAMRTQYEKAPTGKAFAGKYDTWDEYKKAGLEAGDLTGVYGNIKTFGPEWAHLDLDKQKAVTQALIDADLYKTKKGDVEVTDTSKAKQIYEALKGNNFGIQNNPNLVTKPLITNLPARSTTSSPGISKGGKRISYGKK